MGSILCKITDKGPFILYEVGRGVGSPKNGLPSKENKIKRGGGVM